MFLVLVRVSTGMETFLVLPTPTLNTRCPLPLPVLFLNACVTSHRTLLASFDFDFSVPMLYHSYPILSSVASLSVSLFVRF